MQPKKVLIFTARLYTADFMEEKNRLKSCAILMVLIEEIIERGGTCSEPYIQRLSYFLQELMGVPLGFEFVPYKHGMYSFELADALSRMRADYMIQHVHTGQYWPSIMPYETSDLLKKMFQKTIKKHQGAVLAIVDKLAQKPMGELERLTIASYVSMHHTLAARAGIVCELKPHILKDQAIVALNEFDQLRQEIKGICPMPPRYDEVFFEGLAQLDEVES